MKSVSIMEGEATPRRSVPLPVDEKEEETEEAREEGEGGIVVIAGGGGCTWWPCSSSHFKFSLKILKWNQLFLIHFVDVIVADKFSYNCK